MALAPARMLVHASTPPSTFIPLFYRLAVLNARTRARAMLRMAALTRAAPTHYRETVSGHVITGQAI